MTARAHPAARHRRCPSAASPAAARTNFLLALGLLLLVPVALYGRTLSYGLLGYDDPITITGNAFWSDPSWEHFLDCFRSTRMGVYHPLFFAEVCLQRALWGPSVTALRVVQVAAFAGCVALLVPLGRRLGLSRRAALFAALLFAISPVHAESVAWVTARGGPLSGLAVLAACLVYLGRPRLRPSRGLAILVLFLLGLAEKSNFAVVLVPWLFVLALVRGRLRRDAPWLTGALLLGLAWSALTVRTQAGAGDVHLPAASAHLRLVVRALGHYTRRAFLPAPVSPLYEFPDLSAPWEAADALAVVPLALAAALALFLWRTGRRRLLALLAMFYLALAPMAHLVPFNHFVQDRYLFLPSMPWALLVASFLLGKRRGRTNPIRTALVAAGALGLALYAGHAAEAWRSNLDLARWAARVDPAGYMARQWLAAALTERGAPGDAERARSLYQDLSRRAPSADVEKALGLDALRRGDLAEARRRFRRGLAAPGNRAYVCGLLLLHLLLQEDRLEDARALLEDLRPKVPPARRGEVWLNEGHLLLAEGKPAEAADAYARAHRADPNSAFPILGLARALRRSGQLEAAEEALRRLGPDPRALGLAGLLALDRGRGEDARRLAARTARAPEGGGLDGALLRLRLDPRPDAVRDYVRRWGPAGLRRARAEPDLAPLLPTR